MTPCIPHFQSLDYSPWTAVNVLGRNCPNSLFSSLKMGQVGRGGVIIRNIPYYWASWVALVVKNPPANAGNVRDVGSIPGSGRSSGGGHCKPLQYSCLENPMDRGAWWATVHKGAKSQTPLKWLRPSTHQSHQNPPRSVLFAEEVGWQVTCSMN